MKKFLRKLKNKKGESFVEVLISVLIAAFGCLLIATLYSAAMSLNVQASKMDDNFYSDISKMEQMFEEGTTSETGSAKIEDSEGGKLDVSIDKFGNDSNSAYKRHSES